MVVNVELGEVCDFVRGVAFDGNESIAVSQSGYVPILRAGNIGDELYIDDLVWVPENRVSKQQYFQVGDIAICMASGSAAVLGKTAQLKEGFVGSVGAFCGIIRPTKADPTYIAYWLKSPKFMAWRDSQANGVNIQNLRPNEIREIKISLPPPNEQKRIAFLLARADRLRLVRRAAHHLGDELLQSVFLEMFGDPGINPKNWDLMIIEDLLSKLRNGIQTGPFGSSLKRHEYVSKGIPVWGINNLGNNKFVEDNPLYITEEKFSTLKNYTVEMGDIFISRAGTVGRMCVAYPSISPSIIGTNLVRISLDFSIMNPEYFTALFSYFSSRFASLKMTDDQNAYSFINPSILRSMRIPVPPLSLQEEFAGVVRRVESLRARMSEAERQVEGLFESLLAESFGG